MRFFGVVGERAVKNALFPQIMFIIKFTIKQFNSDLMAVHKIGNASN